MAATVQDVEHGHGQFLVLALAEMYVEGGACASGSGVCYGQRYAQDGVGPQVGLVGGAVHVQQAVVQRLLVVGGEAGKGQGDAVVYVLHRLQDTFTPVARGVAVP